MAASQRICSIPDCDKPHHAGGYCASHYARWRKYGDPLAGSTSIGEPHRYLENVVLGYEGDDCLFWPFNRSGYGYAMLWISGKPMYVHRLVCEHKMGRPPSTLHEAAHTCGNGHMGCVSRQHLTWKLPVENQADKLIHGTHNRGERSASAKLTENQVREIRKMIGSRSCRELSERYGVTMSTIYAIGQKRIWGWLD